MQYFKESEIFKTHVVRATRLGFSSYAEGVTPDGYDLLLDSARQLHYVRDGSQRGHRTARSWAILDARSPVEKLLAAVGRHRGPMREAACEMGGLVSAAADEYGLDDFKDTNFTRAVINKFSGRLDDEAYLHGHTDLAAVGRLIIVTSLGDEGERTVSARRERVLPGTIDFYIGAGLDQVYRNGNPDEGNYPPQPFHSASSVGERYSIAYVQPRPVVLADFGRQLINS